MHTAGGASLREDGLGMESLQKLPGCPGGGGKEAAASPLRQPAFGISIFQGKNDT